MRRPLWLQVVVARFQLQSADEFAQIAGLKAALLPDLTHLMVVQTCATASGAGLQAVMYRSSTLVQQQAALKQYADTSAEVSRNDNQ